MTSGQPGLTLAVITLFGFYPSETTRTYLYLKNRTAHYLLSYRFRVIRPHETQLTLAHRFKGQQRRFSRHGGNLQI